MGAASPRRYLHRSRMRAATMEGVHRRYGALAVIFRRPAETFDHRSLGFRAPITYRTTVCFLRNGSTNDGFAKFSPSDWTKRHTAVSEEDFEREPHRNRFAVLVRRTAHLAYHVGQATLARPKTE